VNNKTISWLDAKSPEEKARLIQEALLGTKTAQTIFKGRTNKVKEQCAQNLKQKMAEKEKAQNKEYNKIAVTQKMTRTKFIGISSDLWTSL